MLYLFIFSALAWESKTNASGTPLLWSSNEVGYYLNTTGYDALSETDIERAITMASDAWDPTKCDAGFSFAYQGMTKTIGADYTDGEHVISFDDSWTEEEELLAITYVWANSNDEIFHFDIEINIEHHEWTVTDEEGKHDLTNSMAHEFGHALGLEHSDDLEATMAPTTSHGETQKRDLNPDDIQGFSSTYPAGYNPSSGTENEETDAGSSEGSSGGGAGPNTTPSNTGNGSSAPVALDGGCSIAPVAPLWLGLLGFLSIRRQRRR